MKAIIMVAGRGTRLSRHIKNRPKCTLDIGGITIIENLIKELKMHDINDIALVLGYEANSIREILKKENITFYHNPFYEITNSIASLWFAKEFIADDDMLILNGDVYFESKLLDKICAEKKSPVMFADKSRRKEADYKFYYEGGVLLKYGKELSLDETSGEYANIAKINKEFSPVFTKRLEKLIIDKKYNMWWEDVLYSMIKEVKVCVEDVDGMFWAEVDYFDDYLRILNYLKIEYELTINLKYGNNNNK
jgi:choline kinase